MSWQDTTTAPAAPALPKRPVWTSLCRGFSGCCPACGHGRMFRTFLKVSDQCPACGEALRHHQADDAPAYFVILIVGHLIVPLALITEIAWSPPYWLHAAIWLPLTAGLAIGLLQPIKGAIIGWQWANYMHGFDPNAVADAAADGVTGP
jgi:uncharacterized protein (DUF983 family)